MVAMESTQCQVCGAFFIDKTSLEEHIDSEHTKDELYSCILCLKTTLVQLVGHSRLDTSKLNSLVRGTSPSEPGKDIQEQEIPEKENNRTEMDSEGELGNEGQGINHVTESEQNGGKMEHEDDGLFYMDDTSGDIKNEGVDNSENEAYFSPTKKFNGRFVCSFCQKEFSSHYAQKRHMMSHYDNRPNKCDICGKAFIGKQNLQVHYRIHTGEKPYRCKYCHKRFTQYGTMYRHTQLHLKGRLGGTSIQTGTSLKTDITGDAMVRKQISKNKIRVSNDIRSSGDSQYSKNVYPSVDKSSYFQNNFDDNSDSNTAVIDLSMHDEKNHREDNTDAQAVSEVNSKNSDNMLSKKDETISEINETGNTKIYDSSLSDKFGDKALVISGDKNAAVTNNIVVKGGYSDLQEGIHGNGVNQGQGHNNGISNNTEDRNEHSKLPNNDLLSLSSKQDTTGNSDSLLTGHVGHEMVYCDICDVTFENPESLESHQNLHREGNLHMCLVCGKGFAMGYTLRRHMMIHSGQKPHVCDVCGKSFIEKQELQSHYRVHSSERPYECLYCEKRFAQYETLHEHLQTHKGQEISLRLGDANHKNQETTHRQGEITHKNQGMSPRQGDITHKNQRLSPRQGQITDSVNFATNGDDIKIINQTNVKFDTGNILIKQEVVSEDDGIKNEVGENFKMTSGDESRIKMIDKNDKMHSNRDQAEKMSKLQNSVINHIKQESLEVEYPSVPNYPGINSGSKLLSEFERNRHLFSNKTGNQLPGIASFTSNLGNSSFTGSSINPLVSFHLTCKFCLQVFSHANDLQTHMQIHFANLNFLGQQDSGTVADSGKYEIKSEKNKHAGEDTESKMTKNGKPHKCTVCGKGYQAKYCLRRHMLVHFGEKPFKCQICGRGFIEKQHLTIHFRIHTGEKPYGCKVCGKRFTQYGTLHNHLNIHKRKGMLVGNITDLMDNFVSTNNVTTNGTHIVNDNVPLKEEALDSETLNLNVAVSSQSSKVTSGFSNSENTNNIGSKAVIGQNGEGMKTDFKPPKGKNVGSNHAGVAQMTETVKDCQKVLESQTNGVGPTPPADDKSPYIYNCELCNESFHGKENWKVHMNFHRGDGIYRCETCGKHCGGERALKRHALIHTGVRPFKCDLCEKSFMEKQHLQIHRRIHTGEKPYSCSVCDKRFTQYGTLHKHKRIHTKERPYKCSFCVKAFAERRQLQHHMSTHTDVT